MLKKICQKIDKYEKPGVILGIFLIIWLVINILQSYFTELAHDEAYYWMYSRYLAWGYFDHPPMIAVLVKTGYSIFKNELGVRLFPLLMGTSTIYVIYLLLKDQIKSISLFIMLVCSVLIIQSHVGGFLAIPDLPVVFFAALFYLVYRKYLEKDSIKLAFILGLISAAMMYSKYHGILVLFFTFIANIKIARRWSFWIIPVLTIGLLFPHILWQVRNHFPTVEYHLFDRSSAYTLEHTINFLYSQLLIAGPFIGIIIFYHAAKVNTKESLFLRSLKFNYIGFFIFFFLSSFKGHVEPHWTAIAYIPIIVLAYPGILKQEKAFKWIRILFVPTFLLVLFIRLCLVYNILPAKWKVGNEFHNYKTWAHQIKMQSKGRKVVFMNSFQRPSKYAFYTGGDFATTLNAINYRKNQYDLWHFADSIQGKKVLLIPSYYPDDTLKTVITDYPVGHIDNFRSYYDVKIEHDKHEIRCKPLAELSINIRVKDPFNDTLIIRQARGERLPRLAAVFYTTRRYFTTEYLQTITDTIPKGGMVNKTILVSAPKIPGKYYCYISIVNDYLLPSFNAKPIKIIVKE